MPLRAIIDGEDLLAPFLDDEAWASLKHRTKLEGLDVRLPCCGNSAYLRTSKRGLRHFVHRERGTCTSAPETWQHLKAKHNIVLACRAVGYEAITEASGEGWRADVLATKGNVKVAFEVQWSAQSWEVTQERQQQYRAAGIRGCWLFKRPPARYRANRDVPLFRLVVTEEAATVIFNPVSYETWEGTGNRRVPLTDFVTALLTGKIKFCDRLQTQRRQKVRIVFVETGCWRCHRPHHVYYVHDLQTSCGDTVEADYFARQIIAIVRQFKESPDGQQLQIGHIKERYSKTVNAKYMSFGCPHCDAIVGDFFLHHEIIPKAACYEDQAPAILETEITLSELLSRGHEHWCFPENGQFCCG
ncbi:MAG: competence protein CoiA family protein [Anaerolineae bacterium]|nr:competence protein CoiA family protein [Anaerolineae bacterium]